MFDWLKRIKTRISDPHSVDRTEGKMNGNGTQLTNIEAAHNDNALIQLWQIIGAHKAVSQIAASLGAQSIRGLELIRDRKYYLAAKHETFDSFLDHHPDSPMSYEAFRRRAHLLNNEGDIAFDLLNSLNVPLSQRKLLAGQIEVTENEIKIGEDTVRLDDTARIVELVSTLHKKTQEQQRTNERLSKKLAKGEEDFEKLKRRAIVANPDGTETGQALLTVAGALKNLREKLEDAADEEKQALREQIFELMRTSQLELSVALGVVTADQVSGRNGQPDESLEISDDEAAALLED